MVFVEVAALFSGAKSLFEYNRANFIYNSTINQTKTYQSQKMRILQTKLFREDLRDLFGLTIEKMDTYLIVNTLCLDICLGFFYEGRMPFNVPAWVIFAWSSSLSVSIFFLVMSIWFAIHASITAQTFSVRLLTAWMRLPVASSHEVSGAAPCALDYESNNFREQFRLPLTRIKKSNTPKTNKNNNFNLVKLKSKLVKSYDTFEDHFSTFSKLSANWTGYDSYSRVAMVIGTNQLILSVVYMGVAYYLLNANQWATVLFAILLGVFNTCHISLNINFSPKYFGLEMGLIVLSNILCPLLVCIIAGFQVVVTDHPDWLMILVEVGASFVYFINFIWLLYLVSSGLVEDGGLPIKFSTVSSVDILGFGKNDDNHQNNVENDGDNANNRDTNNNTNIDANNRNTNNNTTNIQNKPNNKPLNKRDQYINIYNSVLSNHTNTFGDMDKKTTNESSHRPHEYEFLDKMKQDTDKMEKIVEKKLLKIPIVPWHNFRIGGIVVLFVWLIGVILTIVNLVYWFVNDEFMTGWDDRFNQVIIEGD